MTSQESPSSVATQESQPRNRTRTCFKTQGWPLDKPTLSLSRRDTPQSKKEKGLEESREEGEGRGEGGETGIRHEETKELTTPVVQARGDSLGFHRRVNIVRLPTHDGVQSLALPVGSKESTAGSLSIVSGVTTPPRITSQKLHYLLFGSPLIRAVKTDEGDKLRPFSCSGMASATRAEGVRGRGDQASRVAVSGGGG